MTQVFPAGFEALEPYAGWSLKSESERIKRRQASIYAEIGAFRDAVLPELEKIFGHLGNASLDALSVEDERLLCLVLSLAEVAPALEFYRQPSVIDGFDPLRFMPVEDLSLRPKI